MQYLDAASRYLLPAWLYAGKLQAARNRLVSQAIGDAPPGMPRFARRRFSAKRRYRRGARRALGYTRWRANNLPPGVGNGLSMGRFPRSQAMADKVFYFQRQEVQRITVGDMKVNNWGLCHAWAPVNIPGISDLEQMFQQIKILRVKVTYIPGISEFDASATYGSGQAPIGSVTNGRTVVVPVLAQCVDYDDGNIPTEGDIEQRNNVIIKPFTRTTSMTVKPKVASFALSSDGTTALPQVVAPAGWLNLTGGGQVLHRGIKSWFTQVPVAGTSTPTGYDPVVFMTQIDKYWFACRGLQ